MKNLTALAFCLLALLALTIGGARSKAADSPPDIIDYRAELNKGAWVRGPNMPAPRQDAAAVVLADRVYVIGGFGANAQQMDTTLVWEPQVVPGQTEDQTEQHAGSHFGSWQYAAPIPEPRSCGCRCVGRLHLRRRRPDRGPRQQQILALRRRQ